MDLCQLKKYAPLIESYLLSVDKTVFLNELQKNSEQYAFMNLILNPSLSLYDYQKQYNKLECSQSAKKIIQLRNLISILKNDSTMEEKEKALKIINQKILQCNFDLFQAPTNKVINESEIEEEFSDNLANEDLSLKSILQNLKNTELSQNIEKQITKIGFEKMSTQQVINTGQNKKSFLLTYLNQKQLCVLEQKQLFKILSIIYKSVRKQDKNYNLGAIYSKLTIDQLQQLPEHIKGVKNQQIYIQHLFRKKFGHLFNNEDKSNEQLSVIERKTKIKNIIAVKKWLSEFHQKTVKHFISDLISEHISLQVLNEDVSIVTLLEFLEKSQKNRQDRNNYWRNIHYLNKNINQSKLTLQATSLILRQKQNQKVFDKLLPYFKEEQLNKIYYTCKLHNGEKINQDLNSIFKKQYLKEIKEKKEITISSINQHKFKIQDNIQLKVYIKNIKVVTVNIYQVNNISYLLANQSEIQYQPLDLNFIQPTKSFNQNITYEGQFQRKLVNFDLTPYLQKKLSIFIIDFKGQSICSRAVIKRGHIICIEKATLAGKRVKFYDQDGKKIQNINLWIQGSLINIKDQYTIPYQSNYSKDLNIIFQKDSYAQKFKLLIEAEKYSLNCTYIYDKQSFIVGKKAKILVQARLYVNDNLISSKFLNKNKIQVRLLSHEDITSVEIFKDVEWDGQDQFQIEIYVHTYLKSIQIIIQSETKPLYDNKPHTFKKNQMIQFSTPFKNQFIDIFLTFDQSGYIVSVLGKNGEIYANTNVLFNLQSIYVVTHIVKTLRTNNQGQVFLGKLESINYFKAEVLSLTNTKVKRQWRIGTSLMLNQVSYQYQQTINIIVNKTFNLPLFSNYEVDSIIFLRYNDNYQIIQNHKSSMKISKNRLKIKLQTPGRYYLYFIQIQYKIHIYVSEGKIWKSDHHYVTDHSRKSILPLQKDSKTDKINFNDTLFIENHSQQQYKVGLELNVPEEIEYEKFRIHIFCHSFFYNDNRAKTIRKQFLKKQQAVIQVKETISFYYNNHYSSEEELYVEARNKIFSKIIGNILDKPSLLLKKVQQQIQLMQQSRQSNFICDIQLKPPPIRNKSRGFPCAYMDDMDNMDNFFQQYDTKGISSNNNFLKSETFIKSNLYGKEIQLIIPKYYNLITVIVTASDLYIQKTYPLKKSNEQIKKKDIRHTKMKKKGEDIYKTGLTIQKKCYRINKNQSLNIRKDTVWKIISKDSIIQFYTNKKIKIWEWLENWQVYTPEKKLEIYSQYCSHQLNLYLKLKYPTFFVQVVLPFLRNKVKKSLVDLCLIQDKRCLQWNSASKLKNLNPFEKCLLIQYLIKVSDLESAKNIQVYLELEYKANRVDNLAESDKLYETLLNTNEKKKQQEPRQLLSAQKVARKSGLQVDKKEKRLERSYDRNSDIRKRRKRSRSRQRDRNRSRSRSRSRSQSQSQQSSENESQMIQSREKYKNIYVQPEKAKQYIQSTYYQLKKSSCSISVSKFWVDLAHHLINKNKTFLTDSFIYLKSQTQITLSLAYLDVSDPKYAQTYDQQYCNIKVQNDLLICVKQLKEVELQSTYGILIYQRFYDPEDPYIYQEDNTKIQKNISQFNKKKMYCCQVVVTNTSVSHHEIQILIDYPEGSIPVNSHQYKKIVTKTIPSYTTEFYEIFFYFPECGEFSIYPANISKRGKIIAKAQYIKSFLVTENKIYQSQSFESVLNNGSKQDILSFVQQKNIFDTKIFNIKSIYWLMKNKTFYESMILLLKKRNYFDENIWCFSLLHKDIKNSLQYLTENAVYFNIPDFTLREYFPIYQKRVHKFMDHSKNIIENPNLKNTYQEFLICSFLKDQDSSISYYIMFTYYLLLQQRIQEAQRLFNKISNVMHEQNSFPQLQYDYIQCFLDICNKNSYPDFIKAKEISSKYLEYPVTHWRKLFKDVHNILFPQQDDIIFKEEQKIVNLQQIKIKNQGDFLYLTLTENTIFQINYHIINLQVFFSKFPFEQERKIYFNVKPLETLIVKSDHNGVYKLQKPKNVFDIFVEPLELSINNGQKKIEPFLWVNDHIKIKLIQIQGIAIVYLDDQPKQSVYCKVYVKMKDSNIKFYKDGYTDMRGKFRYIVDRVDQIQKISILFLTTKGGIIKEINKPPNIAPIQS